MQRPWDWISHDPDFYPLRSSKEFNDFLAAQERKDYPAAAHKLMNANGKEKAAGNNVSSKSSEAVPAGERR